MIIKNVPLETLERAAQQIGAQLYELRDKSTKRSTAYQFRLTPSTESKRLDHYIRISTDRYASTGKGYRRVHAVCWHGHAVFMATVYRDALDPSAVIIQSTFTKYVGALDFFQRYLDTDRDTSHGSLSLVRPADTYKNACLCDSADQYSVDRAITDAKQQIADLDAPTPSANNPLIEWVYGETRPDVSFGLHTNLGRA